MCKSYLYCYVASPYSLPATPEGRADNLARAMAVYDELMCTGQIIPFAPLLNTLWEQYYDHDETFWLEWDFGWLKKCHCLLRLPGISKGADAEELLAKTRGMPVFYSIKELREHYGV